MTTSTHSFPLYIQWWAVEQFSNCQLQQSVEPKVLGIQKAQLTAVATLSVSSFVRKDIVLPNHLQRCSKNDRDTDGHCFRNGSSQETAKHQCTSWRIFVAIFCNIANSFLLVQSFDWVEKLSTEIQASANVKKKLSTHLIATLKHIVRIRCFRCKVVSLQVKRVTFTCTSDICTVLWPQPFAWCFIQLIAVWRNIEKNRVQFFIGINFQKAPQACSTFCNRLKVLRNLMSCR